MQTDRILCNEDEIDLLQLIRHLWRGRFLVLAITIACTVSSAIYAWLATPTYRAQMVVAPGHLAGFGTLAGKVESLKSGDPQVSPIGNGIRLANDSFNLLIKQLESPALRGKFDKLTDGTYHNVKIKVKDAPKQLNPLLLNANLVEPVTIEATALDSARAKAILGEFVAFAANNSATELNSFFTGAGISAAVTPDMLFRREVSEWADASPVNPRRGLVVMLGLVLGLMAGTFAVLVRELAQRPQGTRGQSAH